MLMTKNKALAVATTVVLAGLGGVALSSNKGMPATAPTAQVTTAHGANGAPIVTRTSGGSVVAQTVAAKTGKHVPAQPIVTRASGGGGGGQFEDD